MAIISILYQNNWVTALATAVGDSDDAATASTSSFGATEALLILVFLALIVVAIELWTWWRRSQNPAGRPVALVRRRDPDAQAQDLQQRTKPQTSAYEILAHGTDPRATQPLGPSGTSSGAGGVTSDAAEHNVPPPPAGPGRSSTRFAASSTSEPRFAVVLNNLAEADASLIRGAVTERTGMLPEVVDRMLALAPVVVDWCASEQEAVPSRELMVMLGADVAVTPLADIPVEPAEGGACALEAGDWELTLLEATPVSFDTVAAICGQTNLPTPRVQRLVQSVPTKIAVNVSRVAAIGLANSLREIGAQVDLGESDITEDVALDDIEAVVVSASPAVSPTAETQLQLDIDTHALEEALNAADEPAAAPIPTAAPTDPSTGIIPPDMQTLKMPLAADDVLAQARRGIMVAVAIESAKPSMTIRAQLGSPDLPLAAALIAKHGYVPEAGAKALLDAVPPLLVNLFPHHTAALEAVADLTGVGLHMAVIPVADLEEPEITGDHERFDAGTWDVVIEKHDPTSIATARVLAESAGWSMLTAQLVTMTAPAPVATGLSRNSADYLATALRQVGAQVSVEPSLGAEPSANETATADQPATSSTPSSEPELPELPADTRAHKDQVMQQLLDAGLITQETVDKIKQFASKRKKPWEVFEAQARIRLEMREQRKTVSRAAFEARKKNEVIHVGDGVSGGLDNRSYDADALSRYDLPRLGSAEDVAKAMDIPVAQLRWLSYHREDARCEHYHRFTIPKRSGGLREISSPKGKLRQAQSWILDHVLSKVATHDVSHGFVPGRSTKSMAAPHVNAACVIKVDIKDFFPSITYPRVKGLLRKLGFGEAAATVMALICTEPPRVTTQFQGEEYRVAIGARQLPQGACTSPAITNILCRRLDARLTGLVKKYGWTVTRYADDLAISGPTGDRAVVGQLLGGITRILIDEGFAINRDKVGVYRRARQQRVCGIVVNNRLGLPRRDLRRFRALLHDALNNGPEKANRGRHADFFAYIQGYAAYLHMVDPAKAAPFKTLITQIREKYQTA